MEVSHLNNNNNKEEKMSFDNFIEKFQDLPYVADIFGFLSESLASVSVIKFALLVVFAMFTAAILRSGIVSLFTEVIRALFVHMRILPVADTQKNLKFTFLNFFVFLFLWVAAVVALSPWIGTLIQSKITQVENYRSQQDMPVVIDQVYARSKEGDCHSDVSVLNRSQKVVLRDKTYSGEVSFSIDFYSLPTVEKNGRFNTILSGADGISVSHILHFVKTNSGQWSYSFIKKSLLTRSQAKIEERDLHRLLSQLVSTQCESDFIFSR